MEEEKRIKLILEIFTLAYLVQSQTQFCVFIEYSGHVDSFYIDIRESKENWNQRVCATEFETMFQNRFQSGNKERNEEEWLKCKRDILKSILENHEIPYSEMTTHTETVYRHTF